MMVYALLISSARLISHAEDIINAFTMYTNKLIACKNLSHFIELNLFHVRY